MRCSWWASRDGPYQVILLGDLEQQGKASMVVGQDEADLLWRLQLDSAEHRETPVQDLQTPVWEQLDGDGVTPLFGAQPLHRCRRDDWGEWSRSGVQAPALGPGPLSQPEQAPQSLSFSLCL